MKKQFLFLAISLTALSITSSCEKNDPQPQPQPQPEPTPIEHNKKFADGNTGSASKGIYVDGVYLGYLEQNCSIGVDYTFVTGQSYSVEVIQGTTGPTLFLGTVVFDANGYPTITEDPASQISLSQTNCSSIPLMLVFQ